MRTQRVIALAICFLTLICIVSGLIIWKNANQRQIPDLPDVSATEEVEKEMKSLNKKLEELMRIADGMGNLPPPTNGVISSYHKKYPKKNYEDSHIQDLDPKEGLVLVQTIDSKISIIFKPAPENFEKFSIGSIAPVTFECTKKKKGKCDLDYPYKLFISNAPVELKKFIPPKK